MRQETLANETTPRTIVETQIERFQLVQRRCEGRKVEAALFRGGKSHMHTVAVFRPERSRQVELHAGYTAPSVFPKAREHRVLEPELARSDEVQRIDTICPELSERPIALSPRKGLEDDVPHMVEMAGVFVKYFQKLARAQATDGSSTYQYRSAEAIGGVKLGFREQY